MLNKLFCSKFHLWTILPNGTELRFDCVNIIINFKTIGVKQMLAVRKKFHFIRLLRK